MPNYVNGCVIAVPTENKALYKKHAKLAAAVFKDHGAIETVECWGDDIPEGKVTSFTKAVKCKPSESVVMSWIVWPSRAVQKKAMKKVMSDPRMAKIGMPFDGKRLIFGGFQVLLKT